MFQPPPERRSPAAVEATQCQQTHLRKRQGRQLHAGQDLSRGADQGHKTQ